MIKIIFTFLLLTQLDAYAAVDKPAYLHTYSAVASGFAPGATPTDLCKISGSSSKIVRVTNVSVSSLQSTAGVNNVFLIKRSSDNVGGVSTAMTAIPHMSTLQSTTTSTIAYLQNPTLGNLIGTVKAVYVLSPAAASVADSPFEWNYLQDGAGQPIILRNQNDVLSVNFGGAAKPAGMTVDCGFTWSEE